VFGYAFLEKRLFDIGECQIARRPLFIEAKIGQRRRCSSFWAPHLVLIVAESLCAFIFRLL
jgi:hypothetical protein